MESEANAQPKAQGSIFILTLSNTEKKKLPHQVISVASISNLTQCGNQSNVHIKIYLEGKATIYCNFSIATT